MSNETEYMDIDGPEFLSTINSEIATIRTNARTNTSATDIFDSYVGDKVGKNLCIKVMVHDIEPISSEYVPKMEALLNRIGGKHHKTLTKKWTVPQQPEPVINTDDYVMEIDEFYPRTSDSRWAKHEPTIHEPIPEPVAYLDNDPALVAPKKPRRKLTYSNSNNVPIKNDASWTSIYSPR
ncbi:hypothetical protein INT48_001527 [Thamnidium elegans]|uniref:Uncharacterized protein n=1 Tax=Thamnidium elegans TaxID=101142 RepID=A0A8H7VRE2_9FUNG|nr:hypothetical protein INT48_001527 [Thamnidium elegans]